MVEFEILWFMKSFILKYLFICPELVVQQVVNVLCNQLEIKKTVTVKIFFSTDISLAKQKYEFAFAFVKKKKFLFIC